MTVFVKPDANQCIQVVMTRRSHPGEPWLQVVARLRMPVQPTADPYLDADGVLVKPVVPAVQGPPAPDFDPVTEVFHVGVRDDRVLSDMMIAQGRLVQRSPTPAPSWDAGTGTLTIPVCPEGSTIWIADKIGREILYDGPADSIEETVITLPDAGLYEIEVTAPAPALPQTLMVNINA